MGPRSRDLMEPVLVSLNAALRGARARLEEGGVAEAALDARRLAAHALNLEPSRLAREGERSVSHEELAAIDRLVVARLEGRSVARLIGRRAFHEIELLVGPDVLEPRDDTGALVDLALGALRPALRTGRGRPLRLLDIGTGTGAVALACLHAEPELMAVGTDISGEALALARRNAARLGLGPRFQTVRSDLVGALDRSGTARFDVIVSNPPYIPSGEIASLAPEVRSDPRIALDGGADGLDLYRRIALEAPAVLTTGGTLAVEIGAGQGADVRAIMREGGWQPAGSRDDLGGHERALAFRRTVDFGERDAFGP